MATAEHGTPADMEELVAFLTEDLKGVNTQAGQEPVCVRSPNHCPEDYTVGALKSLKLEVEAELEALMSTPLVKLPSDAALLTDMATEEMQRTAHANARTLQLYEKKVEELKENKKKYETMLKRAKSVNHTLDTLLSQHLTDDDKRVAMQKRLNGTTVLFRFLRGELHYILPILYPDEVSTPANIKSMEDLLDSIVSKMLQEPNDPYVEVDDTMEAAHISLLLSSNLIAMHPNDITRIKFLDPRQ